jgi:O-antigen/teichoic acid export membrane protein
VSCTGRENYGTHLLGICHGIASGSVVEQLSDLIWRMRVQIHKGQTRVGEQQSSREGIAELNTLLEPDLPHDRHTTTTVSRKVAHGTIWSVGGRVAALLAAFISTPFLTRLLGAEQYGIWALANVLTSYLTFTYMGMGTASTTFAAKPYTRKDANGEVAVVWTSLLITLLPATVVVFVVMLTAGPLVERVFSISRHLQPTAVLVIQLTALGFLARIFAEVFNTPQLVRLRINLYTMLNTGLLIVQHGAVVVALLVGSGLCGAVWVVTICSLLTACTHAIASWTLQPALFRPRIDIALVGPLLRFGSNVVVSSILGFVLMNLERLFLAHFGSVQLAYYSVAASLASLVNLVPGAISQPLLPALSTLHAAKEKVSLERLCGQVLRAIALCILPIAIVLCIVGRPLLRLWAGPEFAAHSTVPLFILMMGVVFNSMASVPHNILIATKHTKMFVKCNMVEMIPHLIYTTFLTFWLGAAGAALAWSLRMFFHAILLFAAACKVTDLSVQALFGDCRSYWMPLLVLISTGMISLYFEINPFIRIALAVAGCTGYCGIVWTKILSLEERKVLLQLLCPRMGK